MIGKPDSGQSSFQLKRLPRKKKKALSKLVYSRKDTQINRDLEYVQRVGRMQRLTHAEIDDWLKVNKWVMTNSMEYIFRKGGEFRHIDELIAMALEERTNISEERHSGWLA